MGSNLHQFANSQKSISKADVDLNCFENNTYITLVLKRELLDDGCGDLLFESS